MLLDPLATAIEGIQRRIREHRAFLSSNETRTRMALIDPILQSLGWDTSDPGSVAPEYDVMRGRADYALKDVNGNPVAIIEAKKLGESLDKHRLQMVTYATSTGIAYAGLTDGDWWELYKVFEPVPLDDKRILKVQLSTDGVHHSALNLLAMWNVNLQSETPTKATPPVLIVDPPIGPPPPPPPPGAKWLTIPDCIRNGKGKKPEFLRDRE